MLGLTVVLALTGLAGCSPGAAAANARPSTAWRNGRFVLDTPQVVGQADIVLRRPNLQPYQYMPLGNGNLGVAVWAADGFTAQLNRNDTLPHRLSPGQVEIPGLARMTTAKNFSGRLDLYDGTLTESGGGMTMRAWVLHNTDALVVDVTGAPAGTVQTATLHLWASRSPLAQASGTMGWLSETWVDATYPSGSDQTFGALGAISAGGREVQASVPDLVPAALAAPLAVQVRFKPYRNGSFRIVVAAPHWAGGNALATARQVLGNLATAPAAQVVAPTTTWWHGFWQHAGLIEMYSAHGVAQYLQAIRTIYLYTEAASMGTGLPGSQAGVADLFNFSQDHQSWYPAGYWFWNLRSQVAANLSSGNFALNIPVFHLYLANLANLEAWTKKFMGGRPGICVPETMRYNGNGYYASYALTSDASCDQNVAPAWNSLTITTGAEISLWIWQQYQDTGNISFLRQYYPLMQQSAIFLLSCATKGPDGLLHTVANAHETQWDVPDPTTDIAAMQALFPVVAQAAGLLHTDAALAAQLRQAATELPPYARTDAATQTQLLTPAADAAGKDVIADSYQPTAPKHNGENLGLEPVWPYGLIGAHTVTAGGDNLSALATRTYLARPNVNGPGDWNFDAIDAARLDLASQVRSDLIASVEKYQVYPSGMADLRAKVGQEPYIEEAGVVATALDEALATDYNGTLHFAPAWPAGWDASGSVYIQHGATVDVQVHLGALLTAAIEATQAAQLRIANPWPGQPVEVVDGRSGAVVLAPTTSADFTLGLAAGHTYLLQRVAAPNRRLPFRPVSGVVATQPSSLGPATIGLAAATAGKGAS